MAPSKSVGVRTSSTSRSTSPVGERPTPATNTGADRVTLATNGPNTAQGHSYKAAPKVEAVETKVDQVKFNLTNVNCDDRDFTVTVTGTGAGSLTKNREEAVAQTLAELISLVTQHPECKDFVSVKFVGGRPPMFARAVVTVPNGAKGTRIIELGGRNPETGKSSEDFCYGGNSKYVDEIQNQLERLRKLLNGSIDDVSIKISSPEDRTAEETRAATARKTAAESLRAKSRQHGINDVSKLASRRGLGIAKAGAKEGPLATFAQPSAPLVAAC